LAAAHELVRSGGARVTLYEEEDHLGGHARTMAVDDDDSTGPVHLDLGFMVFNRVRIEHLSMHTLVTNLDLLCVLFCLGPSSLLVNLRSRKLA
ncbi:hypothetical protein BAE44_0013299, partial [Dichanthelium oligosanthes]